MVAHSSWGTKWISRCSDWCLGRSVAGLSSRRPHSVSTRFHVGLVLNKVTVWQVFLRVFLFSPVHIVTDAPSACCSYQKYKWAKPANFPNSDSLSEIAEHWIENTPTYLSSAVMRTSGRSLEDCIQSNVVAVIGEHWRGHNFHVVF